MILPLLTLFDVILKVSLKLDFFRISNTFNKILFEGKIKSNFCYNILAVLHGSIYAIG